MPTTDKNHLAASGGQLFLKEVFINFVVRLVNDREGEQVENRTGKQGRIQSPFKSNRDSISVCLFLFFLFFIAVALPHLSLRKIYAYLGA